MNYGLKHQSAIAQHLDSISVAARVSLSVNSQAGFNPFTMNINTRLPERRHICVLCNIDDVDMFPYYNNTNNYSIVKLVF